MKYIVCYSKTQDLQIEVEAKDREKAREKSDEILENKTSEELDNESQLGCWEHTDTEEV